MKIINLLSWDISYQTLMFWCHDNNVPVRRISIAKFSIPEKDFLMFKLTFDKQKKPSMFREEE
jgi:hypothetical protein